MAEPNSQPEPGGLTAKFMATMISHTHPQKTSAATSQPTRAA